MKNTKISVYVRPMTLDLLDKYCEAFQLDRSRAVDDLLYGRLEWIMKAEAKVKKLDYKTIYKMLDDDTWFDLGWECSKEQPDLEKFKKVGLTLEQFKECYNSKR